MRISATLALAACLLAACATKPKPENDAERDALHKEVQQTIKDFKAKNKKIGEFFDDAHAYVVFPSVGKIGVIIGGAGGDGEVYEGGSMIGWAGMSQVSLGAQLGGKKFAQVVFFETEETFAKFKASKMEFGAGVDAVAADSEIGLTTGYKGGIAVFVWSKSGLMADASGSGQKFTFVAK
jgi:lipid-binding SYLF domain-containing protein